MKDDWALSHAVLKTWWAITPNVPAVARLLDSCCFKFFLCTIITLSIGKDKPL